MIGAVSAAPVCVAATLWACRRLWRNAQRLSARARGQEHLAELGQLVGGLAHEIKNPLSTVNLNLKLLAEDLARYDDDGHRRMLIRLKNVRQEADRVRGILDDFLRFAGKLELSRSKVDLRDVVDDLADFFSPQAEATGIILRTALADSPVICNIDTNLFKQAMLNLMLNAVQAMDKTGELLIKVSLQRSRAIVEVIDTGAGIAPEEMKKIFSIYYSGGKKGIGLGLPTTRRIIRAHDGTISVESEPGRGTRFIISLPLA